MNASNSSLSPAKWLRLLALLTATGAMLPLDLHATNPAAAGPAGKEKGEEDAKKDGAEDPSQKEGSDCDGTEGKQDKSCNLPGCPCPDTPTKCIQEEVRLGIAPNHPALNSGKLKLYIDKTGDNLASRLNLEFFGIPQMSVTEKNDQTSRSDLGIVQAGGTRLMFGIDSTRQPGASVIQGMPMGSGGYSQARISYVDSAGAFSERGGASFIRQFRAGAGTVDYPANGGKATRFETRQGRVYTFPLNQMEVIRERANGTFVINGEYGDGLIRQVKTVAGLLDVVPLGDRAYEIRKYAPQQVGAKSNGLFTATSAPHYKTKVEAPADTRNKLTITVTEGSLVTVSNHTITLTDGAEEWVEDVAAGEFNYRRSLVKQLAPELGASYKRSKWMAYLMDGGGAAIAQPGTGYEMDMVSYNNAMVSSTQTHSSGATQSRSRDLGSVLSWDMNGVGRPAGQQTSSGSAISYAYDSESRMTERSFTAAFSSGSGGSAPPQRREQYSYAALRAGESVGIADFRPRTTTRSSGGTGSGKAFFSAVKINGAYNEREERTPTAAGSFGDTANVRHEKEWYGPGEHQGRLKFELKEDGTMERYEYVTKPGDGLEITTFKKLDSSGNPVNGYSTRVRELRDVRAWPIETTTAAWTGSAWVDYETIYQTRNEAGRLTREEHEDKLSGQRRVTLIQEWDGPMLTRKVDEQSIATSYEYFTGTTVVKKARREAIAAVGDFPAQPEIVTTYSGSFTMNETQVPVWKTRTTTITAGDLTLTEQETFDEKGRVVSHIDKNGYTTTTVYSEGDKVVTETLPSGATRITRKDSEGRVLSLTGTGVVAKFYHYIPLETGGEITTVYFGTDNGPRYETTVTDGSGRVVTESRPAFGSGTTGTIYTYSALFPDSIVKVVKTGEATKVRELNAVGACVREGLTVDDATLTLASATDRITDMATTVEQDSTGLWRVTRKSVYPEAGSSTAKVIKTTRTKLGGLTGTEIARTETADIVGNVTTERTLLSGTVSEERISRPGITGEEISIYQGDQLMSVAQPGISGVRSFGYDALGREISRKEPRHVAASHITYAPGANLVVSASDAAGSIATYAYYGQGVIGAGKLKAITLSDNSVKNMAYTLRGEKRAEWGSQTYPTWFEYDAYGKRVELHTWQIAPTLDIDAFPSTLPTGSAMTTWNYDAGSGLLANKRYADNKGPDYSYDVVGRLALRTWARMNGANRLTTAYTWDGFGQLTGANYADDTPDVTIAYDRIGHIVSQGNGVAVSAFAYSADTLRLVSETVTYDLNRDGAPELVRELARSNDSFLRPSGYQLKNGSTVEAEAGYAYDSAGRLNNINGGTLGTFAYDYMPSSNLIAGVTGPVHTVTNTYEENRDVLDRRDNKVGTTVVSAYDYGVDTIGHRTGVLQSGIAFASNRSVAWGYDGQGEVTSADSSEAGHDRAYEYDSIGNRKKSADSLVLPASDNYTANALNQYDAVGSMAPVYNDDGDAIAYPLVGAPAGNSTLAWDGENRLKNVTINGVNAIYYYDMLGRRIAKLREGQTAFFIYDGGNSIGEYGVNGLKNTRLWGLDLSGAIQYAGGAGGLLAERNEFAPNYPTYDGNGNVSEYISPAGDIVAHFEYDTFGRSVVDTDSAGIFAIRFGTKHKDVETGLYYYGYRYYNPTHGKWLNRDPLVEKGGLNLNAFCRNDAVNFIDVVGASQWQPVPGNSGWDYRFDQSAGNGDPQHIHYRKDGKEYARRSYDEGSQKKHGKGVDKDVPEDVVEEATKKCKKKFNTPQETEEEEPEEEGENDDEESERKKNSLQKAAAVAAGVGLVAAGIGLAVGTVVEDVVSGGAGIADDPISFGAAWQLMRLGASAF